MGLVRAVDVGRRWNCFDVALRCCFAYSLEHYHSCLRTFSLWEHTRQQNVNETAREPPKRARL